MRKRVCVLSFSWLRRDGRVLRQARHLGRRFDVTLVGWGRRPEPDQIGPDVDYLRLRAAEPPPTPPGLARALLRHWERGSLGAALRCKLYEQANALQVGRLWPPFSSASTGPTRRSGPRVRPSATCPSTPSTPTPGRRSRSRPRRRPGAAPGSCSTPTSTARSSTSTGAPGGSGGVGSWEHLLARHAPRADAVVTVCARLAERYAEELGVEVEVVHNAPEVPACPLPARARRDDRIDVVHQGSAHRIRQPGLMIRAIAASDRRFHLHLMFVDRHRPECAELERLARRVAPGRVTFHDPVPPERIVQAIAGYDVGLWISPPTTYNLGISLPNKLFERIIAELPIVAGPTRGAGRFVAAEGVGVVTPSFEPADVAATLKALTPEALEAMRARCRDSARRYNADVELGRLVAIYERLLGDRSPPPDSLGSS